MRLHSTQWCRTWGRMCVQPKHSQFTRTTRLLSGNNNKRGCGSLSCASFFVTRDRLLYGRSLLQTANLSSDVSSSGTSSKAKKSRKERRIHENAPDMTAYPSERVRNFSIIAHIDHGKSTLADRLLELTGTIRKQDSNKQVMDRLQVEQERGITVKAQTATMFYDHEDGHKYMLNLIDTPGHVDFGYEVSCSLAASQGTLLVVDAAQGIQAQTLANFFLAFEKNLTIIPVINKIDMTSAQVEDVTQEIVSYFDMDPSEILYVSAKTGLNCEQILPAIIERIPPPQPSNDGKLRALLFDSWYDVYRGIISLIHLVGGKIAAGDEVTIASSNANYEVLEVGILSPTQKAVASLEEGQVGYLITGMKSSAEARVGDTLYRRDDNVEALPGFKPAKCMVFAGLYPIDQDDYESLSAALDKLCLNDPSVTIQREVSPAMGPGWRIGFLGMLHMDVFSQRLQQEYDLETVLTSPSVAYLAEDRNGTKTVVDSVHNFPDTRNVKMYEPIVTGTLVTPERYLGKLVSFCYAYRGVQKDIQFLSADRVIMTYSLPLNEIIEDFYDKLKSLTSGYASFDTGDLDYEASDIVLLTIMLNGEPVDALSRILHKSQAYPQGRQLCERLKAQLKRQQYDIAVQASVNNKVIARETVKAVRKDVTAKCYGGDITRKRKLLEKQKEGKKRMRMIGTVEVPKEAFFQIIKR
eukprot:m.52437 g.52437  ORF g.52437 m.52437 type:complete len:694 (-) comp10791_c0_seq1:1145-3226(-)